MTARSPLADLLEALGPVPKRHPVRDALKLMLAGAISVGLLILAGLIQAQVICFGLSLFHVDSGLWGPYLLASAFEASVACAVALAK